MAVYTSQLLQGTIIWQNYNGTVLQTKTYLANEGEPSYSGSTPSRSDYIPSSGTGTRYTFSGWTLISSSGLDKTYRANFSSRTLYIWDRYNVVESVTESYVSGETFYDSTTGGGPNQLQMIIHATTNLLYSTSKPVVIANDHYILSGASTLAANSSDFWYNDATIYILGDITSKNITHNHYTNQPSGVATIHHVVDIYVGGGEISESKYYTLFRVHKGSGSYASLDVYCNCYQLKINQSQGSTKYSYVTSTSSSSYPSNGISGSYWYVRR